MLQHSSTYHCSIIRDSQKDLTQISPAVEKFQTNTGALRWCAGELSSQILKFISNSEIF